MKIPKKKFPRVIISDVTGLCVFWPGTHFLKKLNFLTFQIWLFQPALIITKLFWLQTLIWVKNDQKKIFSLCDHVGGAKYHGSKVRKTRCKTQFPGHFSRPACIITVIFWFRPVNCLIMLSEKAKNGCDYMGGLRNSPAKNAKFGKCTARLDPPTAPPL